jgi:predicted esterase
MTSPSGNDGAPADTTPPGDAAPPPCTGQSGDFHSVVFPSGGEDRFYFLHVPADYHCADAWPLLVDFHGTGSGQPTDPVEEAWAFDEMIEAADTERFIVVRPRSRFAAVQGDNIFQWDINPGDPAKNLEFATALIADLKTRYHIDDRRVYASGFSNGPSQALQFLGVDPSPVHGYMIVNGGLNEPLHRTTQLPADAGRIYVTVGFRDYMWSTTRTLYQFLALKGYDPKGVWQRQSNTGHELYGWHYHEAFRWMDRAERPSAGSLKPAWTKDASFTGQENLITLATDASGRVTVAGEGAIYRRGAAGGWAQTASLGTGTLPPHVNGICFLGDGSGLAFGEGTTYASADGSSWAVSTAVASFGNSGFPSAYLNGLACSGEAIAAGGLWEAAVSVDGGKTWAKGSMPLAGGFGAGFVTAVRRSATGTWMSSGYYNYLGRSTDGAGFAAVAPAVEIQWYNDVAPAGPKEWWAVGEKGTVIRSSDDGVTFTAVPVPTTEDLYAVSFSGIKGLVVGAHGAAWLTVDAGATWRDVSTGLDGYLGAVTWLDAGTVLAAGEAGTVITLAVP